MNWKFLASLLLVLAAFGCATATQIISEPPGAKVYDKSGTELGTTPFEYKTSVWLWETNTLTLKKDGYQDKNADVKRNEIDIMPALGSVGMAVCLSWTGLGLIGGVVLFLAGGMKYPAETKVTLDPATGAPAPAPEAAPESTPGAGSDIMPPPMACPVGLPIAMRF
ncbi:MAG: hypothetical protein JXR83_15810 [Deltaproteobacteria bacterium]|nr:hypothetical protein [Deltaproteobacteria bacterium]